MPSRYRELVAEVIDWSNRQPDVFNATIPTRVNGEIPSTGFEAGTVGRFLRYAADKCYRHLRVPSLAISRDFVVEETDIQVDPANLGLATINIPVPQDLIDIIYIRDPRSGCVFEEKVDSRTFFQRESVKTSPAFWTRTGNTFRVAGRIEVGTTLEIHYYRRLPALDATYFPTAATYNIDPSVLEATGMYTGSGDTVDGVLWFPSGTTTDGAGNVVPVQMGSASDSRTTDTPVGISFTGNEADHWLRDENERILLFGALAEAAIFLQDGEDLQQYIEIFAQEIEELNREEKMRQTKGGNIKVNFNGGGLI